MSGDAEPLFEANETIRPPSHRRILVLMAVIGVIGGIAGFAYISAAFALGVLTGTAFAFVNYFWLKRSLKSIFEVAASGEKPRMLVGKYFLRYLLLGAVIAVIYMTGTIPIVAVILGMAGFGFAVVAEGFIRIFTSTLSEPPA